ncbi:bifunctional Coatomer [Babesia duncani]|uniref:Coatomer subunit gamma n=1 Tax=Babesia duncani TaxID=323732 RepID=A0AAD9UQL5_9APIC|nr:bifunctional Coatomer [Babesia duncani]
MGVDLNVRLETNLSKFDDKNSILHDARVFTKTPINAKKCIAALTRILGLLNHGNEILTPEETTGIFFGATRLFECNDERLRRLVYLLIKSLSVNETEVFIVTSSLTKDVNSSNAVYRANAIRALCCIVNTAMASQFERFIKSSLVERDSYVSSSALLCCICMHRHMPTVLRRWMGEITACLSSPHKMVQFHATLLIFVLRMQDRQSLWKLVTDLVQGDVTNTPPEVEIFVIRLLSSSVLGHESESTPLLKRFLSSPHSATKLEACKAISKMALDIYKCQGSLEGFPFDIGSLMECLCGFLDSKDGIMQFAAMRIISEMAEYMPLVTSLLNSQIEALINNPLVSAYALVSLLHTGGDEAIDKLLDRASDLTVDLKLQIARAITRKCVEYPHKHASILTFYANGFRDETGYEAKREMVEGTIRIVNEFPQATRMGLLNLCEFIEDCEYVNLCTRILHYLGDKVPQTQAPQDYVRFIYNRMLLEGPLVRCAAIDALGAIVSACPHLGESIAVLLKPCMADLTNDDELRERIAVILVQLHQPTKIGDFKRLDLHPSVVTRMCHQLEICIETDDYTTLLQDSVEAFVQDLESKIQIAPRKLGSMGSIGLIERRSSAGSTSSMDIFHSIADYLPPNVSLITTQTNRLTDEEEDYGVVVTTHVSPKVLILQFDIVNTIADQLLEHLRVHLVAGDLKDWKVVYTGEIDQLHCNEVKQCFVILEHRDSSEPVDPLDPLDHLLTGTFQVHLEFDAKSGPNSQGYHEQFRANDFNLAIGHWCSPWPILHETKFNAQWDQWEQYETTANFALGASSAKDGAKTIIAFFGPDNVQVRETGNELLQHLDVAATLAGSDFIAKANIAHGGGKCLLKLRLRTPNPRVTHAVLAGLD